MSYESRPHDYKDGYDENGNKRLSLLESLAIASLPFWGVAFVALLAWLVS